MWRRRNGKYTKEVVKQIFVRHMEKHMDMVSGKIGWEEVRYPLERVCFSEDDVRKESRAIRQESSRGQIS